MMIYLIITPRLIARLSTTASTERPDKHLRLLNPLPDEQLFYAVTF